MATTRSLLRHAAAIICIAGAMVLVVPTPADAGTLHATQRGKAGQKATGARTGQKVAPSTSSTQRCPCPARRAAAYAQAHRQMGFHKQIGAPRPGTARTMVRRLFQGRSPSWGQASWDRAFANRMALVRPSFPLQDRQPQQLDTWKIRIIDGDTFAYGPSRIRLRGIDAPEVAESGGFEATQRLAALLHEGPVTIVPEALDKYGRTVADVYVNDQNVAEAMRSEGYAKPR